MPEYWQLAEIAASKMWLQKELEKYYTTVNCESVDFLHHGKNVLIYNFASKLNSTFVASKNFLAFEKTNYYCNQCKLVICGDYVAAVFNFILTSSS